MVSDQEWVCRIEITRGTTRLLELDVPGFDAFQALRLAMQAIRRDLLERFPSITWLSGEAGDTGFDMEVPGHYGRDFARHLEALIDSETLSFGAEFRRRNTRKPGPSSARPGAKRRSPRPRAPKDTKR